jgi:NtrC-family two-component system sensor histidine kinase KinB
MGLAYGTWSVQHPLVDARARADAAEDRLRSQTMLLAEAEHRLKTALAVITGWATTLDERWDQLGDDRRREGVGIIRRASEGLAEEARRLLDDARDELLTMDAERVRLDLCAVLDVTTAAFGENPTRHAVVHETNGGSVPVQVDPGALQQILGHLIENAVKYSPPNSQVTVRARSDGDRAVLEVSDEGVGVPVGVDLFAPFQRGDDVLDAPGVGLGLYLVRNLVRAMDGDIVARRDGGGSTFVVSLPLAR